MPRGRSRRLSGQRIIKPDPDPPRPSSRDATVVADVDAESITSGPDDQATTRFPSRHGRSDARKLDPSPIRPHWPLLTQRPCSAAPSEPVTEPDPLLREIRARDNGAHIGAAEQNPANLPQSFFQTSFQDIGRKLKGCNDTLGELQQLGVSHKVQLPELVLVGDQSAGKSSLMSGLANLDLPRSEGTCTRCPLHIRVSRNSDWSCRVWLRRRYHYQRPADRDITEADVTTNDPFFPWRERASTSVSEFKTVHDKNGIEEVLRWAQIAILNDDKHPGTFVPGSGSTALQSSLTKAAAETAAKFSPNIVALEIKGPDLPDLSFYDMPGIFENPADARDDYLVNVVRNLTRSYVSHQSAIILCCMPMNSDAENSSTFGLIRRDRASHRTIGVLTKADLLPDGNHEQWLSIMSGLGYFVTSRPPGKNMAELKDWEDRLFETNSFDKWPETFHPFTARCGIERLKASLSERLGEEFAKSLPTIKQSVKNNLDRVNRQLKKLPELPDNIALQITTALMAFADNSRHRLDDFVRHFNVLPRNFRDCLLEVKPKFTLKDKSDIPVLEISDDDSDGVSGSTNLATPSSRRTANQSFVTPSKRPRTNGHSTPVPNNHVKPEEGNGTPGALSRLPKRVQMPEPFTRFQTIGRGFRTLRQVREHMQAKTKAGMPGRISDDVYVDLVKEAIKPWDGPLEAFVQRLLTDLHNELNDALLQALEHMNKRNVYKHARDHLKVFIRDTGTEMEAELVRLHEDEKERLLTYNEEAFKRYKADESLTLTRFRHHMRMEAAGHKTRPLNLWSEMTESKRILDARDREAELSKLGPDQFERELEVIAYVRGYYRLAALRFTDAVSQRVLCRTIPDIRRKLPSYLEDKLGLREPVANGTYERLMAEDESTAAKREALKSDKEKFDKALASIELLEAEAWRTGGDGDEGQSTQPLSPAGVDVEMAEA